MRSAWVKKEYQRAEILSASRQADLRMIPSVLRDATLPGFVTMLQWVDFRDPSLFDKMRG
jgi:hypothetical protein